MFSDELWTVITGFADDLNVEAAALAAVIEVESAGRLSASVRGKAEPLIRFEGHYFDRFLTGDARLEARQLGLASPRAGAVKNPRRQAHRWSLLNKAIRINRIAALSSTSWGVGQVMGAHWQWLGYGSVDALVAEARSGVAGQVAVMVRYIDKAGLVHALQQRDWVAFARTYNGPAYARNSYDRRMASAYARHAKARQRALPRPIDMSEDSSPLCFGARGEDVRVLQRALTKCGYVLVADGMFGLITDRVLREFQRDNLLPANGIAGEAELALLGIGVKGAINHAFIRARLKASGAAKNAKERLASLRTSLRQRLRGTLLSISRRLQ